VANHLAPVQTELIQQGSDSFSLIVERVAEVLRLIAEPEAQEIHQQRAVPGQYRVPCDVRERRSGCGFSSGVAVGKGHGIAKWRSPSNVPMSLKPEVS